MGKYCTFPRSKFVVANMVPKIEFLSYPKIGYRYPCKFLKEMFCKDVYLGSFGNEGNIQVFFSRLLINLLLLLPVLTRYHHLFGPSLTNKLQVRNYLLLLQLPVCSVALNRPEKMNALNHQMWEEIGAVFDRLATDPDCRAIVLRHGQIRKAGHL